MNTYKELQIFLIKKFAIVVLAVSVAEYGIISLINHTLVPFVMHTFFGDADMDIIGLIGLAYLMLMLLGNVILTILQNILPSSAAYPVTYLLNSLDKTLDTIMVQDNGTVEDMNIKEKIFLLMILLTILVVVVVPYLIGAVYYAKIVINQVRQIEEADRAKQKEYEKKRNLMLSDIAHDLRTPITTVSGYAKALSDGMVSEERQDEYLNAIQNKSRRMNDLINLLFDYVRLDSEGFRLSIEKVDICELVREAAAFQFQDIEDAGMELEVDIPEDIIKINADKLQLSRVITNLITNAIKHNSAGTKIGLFLTNEEEKIRVMVADTGEMIGKEHSQHIFEPFVMGDESRSTKGGSGLGLSIVKKVVEMHGFNIRLVQQPMIRKYPVVENYSKMFMIVIDNPA